MSRSPAVTGCSLTSDAACSPASSQRPSARSAPACGSGWSSIPLARAYPAAHIDGIDLDQPSIAEARHNAVAADVTDRVRFECRDASDPALAGQFDLVTLFETLHDLADPVSALRAAAALLAPGGAVLIGDEKVAETFTAPGDELERFQLRLECPALPPRKPHRADVGWNGNRDPARDRTPLRPGSGFLRCHGPAHRTRPLALLPPRPMTTHDHRRHPALPPGGNRSPAAAADATQPLPVPGLHVWTRRRNQLLSTRVRRCGTGLATVACDRTYLVSWTLTAKHWGSRDQ